MMPFLHSGSIFSKRLPIVPVQTVRPGGQLLLTRTQCLKSHTRVNGSRQFMYTTEMIIFPGAKE